MAAKGFQEGDRNASGVKSLRAPCTTQTGMLGLWDYHHFPMIVDEASWERTMADDHSLKRQVDGAYFVPIRVEGEGPWDMEVRVGADLSLTDRERAHVSATSRTYLFRASTFVCFGGMECVEALPPTSVGVIDIDSGEYITTIHQLDWAKEPGATGPRGARSPDSLPDFVVLLEPRGDRAIDQETSLNTFNPFDA